MSRNWTENQKLAIDARGGSLLVSAAAGSGKTAVLVERVIRMITDSDNPVPIDRLLIVTYTRAAAAELRERISTTLNKLIADNPHNPWYRRQLVYLPRANISTVDSFCGDLVREFFQHLDISGDYRIADNGELSILKQDAMELTLEAKYAEIDDNFISLVESFSSQKDDSRLSANILRLYEFLRSHPFADTWLDEKLSYYTDFEDASDSVWGRVIIEYALSAVDYAISLTELSIKMMEEEPELLSKLSDLFYGDLQYLTTLKDYINTADWNSISRFASTFVTGRLVAKGYTNHPIKLTVAEYRKIVRDTVKIIQGVFDSDEEDFVSDVRMQLPIVRSMFSCVTLFDQKYTELKKSRNVADFSDIEHWALDLLVSRDKAGIPVPTEIASLVSKRFDAVMVDEYQDANEVQDLIFNCVSGGGSNLFVVGDVKQSIYGFRQAMPEIFLSRKNSLPLYSPDEDNYPAKVILERNFRSRREVTDYINFTFRALMSTETGDLEYNHEEALVPAATYPEASSPCTQLHLIDLSNLDDELDACIAEARHIASVIHRMCNDTYITDGSRQRLAQFGDFAIVMRNMSRYGDVYASELKRMGIPAVCETTSEFLSSYEIKVTMNFLRVIDNPVQDIPLLSVLMSPVYGFTSDDLCEIRQGSRKTPLYIAVVKSAQQGNEKCKRFLRDMEELRNLSLTMSADLFINHLYETTALPSIFTVTEGELAVNNLHLLSEYAAAYEKGNSKGISSFVNYIDRLISEGTDIPAATTGSEAGYNAVRIMTVHGSKGLEFPVCILANTARRFLSDTSENALLHSKLGFASKNRDFTTMCSYNTIPRKALALEIKRSEMSEELRVLYVAMTRAKEHLIMLCTKKNMQNYVGKFATTVSYNGKISPYVVRGASNLSDWLVMSAMLHPCAKSLREYACISEPETFACDNTGNFSVSIIESVENKPYVRLSDTTSSTIYEDVPDNIGEIISRRFDFEYPDSYLTTLPQKVTASELAHKDSKKRFSRILRKPAFLYDSPLSPAEKGTAMHLFLEKCDYLKARENVEDEISRLTASKILSPAQAKVLDVSKLSAFINSEIVTLALNSNSYRREYRFTVNIPAYMADNTLSGNDADYPVILQGSIDLAIEREDGIIIVDYKTDRVKDTSELLDMYSTQLMLYRQAMQSITGKPVIRSLIYSVYLSETTEVL